MGIERSSSGKGGHRRPSLRRRLLLVLLLPMLLLLVVDAVATYVLALKYSNHVHDADLMDDVITLAQMYRDGGVSGDISKDARFLIEYDPDGHNYYSVRSSLHGLISGNGVFRQPLPPPPDAAPKMFDSRLSGTALRGATLSMRSTHDPQDIVTVSIAETLHDRQQRARQILMITVPLEMALIAGVLLLVWLGVARGLYVLHPLTRRLAARERELEPITGPDVPVEILPLTRTIDDLFERLRDVLSLQERFIADAAHQLRTPLAGLRLQVDRARASHDPGEVHAALELIDQLVQRTARTSQQLLALTRAQGPWRPRPAGTEMDLAGLVTRAVGLRVPEALRAGIDLGYQGPSSPLSIHGDPEVLQDMLDNLIDNVLRYAGRGAHATVSVQALPDGSVLLQVEDTGPGVPAEALARLGERFFRVSGSGAYGTGLGLAIVREVAQQHGALVAFAMADGGGLRISLQFPGATKS